MKHYHIKRDGRVVVTVTDGDKSYELTPVGSQKARNHSPDGFEFGYGGSGPAQLALAILMDFTGDVPDLRTYQDFKFERIATIQGDEATLTGHEIVRWLAQRDFPQKEGS